MAQFNYTPMQPGFSRMFIQRNGARVDRSAVFHNCIVPDTIDQSYGDITKIECPSPTAFNQFIEIGSFQGADERPTTSLMSRYPADIASFLKRVADIRCENTLYINIGTCTDPAAFSQADKTLIFEGGVITNYSTDTLGTLSSDGRGEVNENADISARRWYEFLKLTFALRAGDIVTTEMVDVVICDNISCGDCDDPSDGCEKIFAVTVAAGGSPSTPPDVVYSLDGGTTFQAVDVDTIGAAQDATGIACVGDYVVVTSNVTESVHIALISEFTTTPSVTWTEVTTGFVAGAGPNDIWSVGSTAFIVGDSGYVYKMTDPTAGVTVIDAGVAVADDLNAVHALDDEFMVAVGNAGSIVKTENGSTVAAVTPSPVGVGTDFLSVWLKGNDSDQWFIGDDVTTLHNTVNNGTTFGSQTFAGPVRDIAFGTEAIGYVSTDTAGGNGLLYRTKDGGNTWVKMPEKGGLLPDNGGDQVNAVAACVNDQNFLVAVGLADDGSDGFIMVASD